MNKSNGAFISVVEFLSDLEMIKIQLISKRHKKLLQPLFRDKIMPMYKKNGKNESKFYHFAKGQIC